MDARPPDHHGSAGGQPWSATNAARAPTRPHAAAASATSRIAGPALRPAHHVPTTTATVIAAACEDTTTRYEPGSQKRTSGSTPPPGAHAVPPPVPHPSPARRARATRAERDVAPRYAFFAAAARFAAASCMALVIGMPGTLRRSSNTASKFFATSLAERPPSLYMMAIGFGVWKSV
jgi:hypothetical protein